MENLLEESWRLRRNYFLKFFDNKNIIKHEILYPSPNRYFDSDIETIGYENEVIFPIRLNLEILIKILELK